MFYMSDEQLLPIVGEVVENTDLCSNEKDLLRVIDGKIENWQIFVEPKTPLKCLERNR